jgi:hypothetical protein
MRNTGLASINIIQKRGTEEIQSGISTISRLPNQISLHHQASTSEKAHRDKEASKETLQSTKQHG